MAEFFNENKRILLVAANPTDSRSLALPKEFRDIEARIQSSEYRDFFEIKPIGATRYNDFRQQLLLFKPHIVHFSGHGVEKGLVLEDDHSTTEIASTERITELLSKVTEHLECIIFNACDSVKTAEAVHTHIDYSIGMNAPIQDPVAIDFSIGFYDAIGAGYSYKDAFDLGLNNIGDNTQDTCRSFVLDACETHQKTSAIPELFSPQLKATQLSQNERSFVDQVFSQLNQGVPQVILCQDGRDTGLMAKEFKTYANTLFGEEQVLHIYPPANPKANEAAYFKRLAHQCRFTEPCEDSTEWAWLMESKLEQGEPLFLLVTDFEKGSDTNRRSLAGELRQLQETFSQQFKIVLFGGEKLAEQVFVAGELSFLNHAYTQYVPELSLQDLKNQSTKELDEQTLMQILHLSGGHPLLVRHLLNGIDSNDYQQALETSSWPNRLFTRYCQQPEHHSKVCNWLQNETIQAFTDWPMDTLVRDLYWNNLLTRQNGQFRWRCDTIQKMGKKVLAC